MFHRDGEGMRLVDSHCHLQDERIANGADRLIVQAGEQGVRFFAVCGSSPEDWPDVRALAKRHPQVIPFYGVHPWYVHNLPEDWFEQLICCLDERPGGIGEIGLDHAVTPRDDALQEAVFLRQLELARERALPVQIHCRRAWDRMPALLARHPVDAGMVIHSYSGSAELVKTLSALPVYFSFSGSITRSGNHRGHNALRAVPMERLLIETDAPDIPMVINHVLQSDEPNKPENLVHVLAQAAALKMMTPEALGEQLWKNSLGIFKMAGDVE